MVRLKTQASMLLLFYSIDQTAASKRLDKVSDQYLLYAATKPLVEGVGNPVSSDRVKYAECDSLMDCRAYR